MIDNRNAPYLRLGFSAELLLSSGEPLLPCSCPCCCCCPCRAAHASASPSSSWSPHPRCCRSGDGCPLLCPLPMLPDGLPPMLLLLLPVLVPEMAVPTCPCCPCPRCFCFCSPDSAASASYRARSLPARDLAQAELGPDRSDQYAEDFLVYFRFPLFPPPLAELALSLLLEVELLLELLLELELAEEAGREGGGGVVWALARGGPRPAPGPNRPRRAEAAIPTSSAEPSSAASWALDSEELLLLVLPLLLPLMLLFPLSRPG